LFRSQSLTPVLTAVRVSRCVRERLDSGGRAVVLGVQRRACHLALDDGPLLVLSMPDVPLAPNGFSLDLGRHPTPAASGFYAGQSISLRSGPDFQTVHPGRGAGIVWKSKSDPVILLGEAATWEPRPSVPRSAPPDLAARLRTVRATVVAEGARESLLPLLWVSEHDAFQPGVARAASPAARLLREAAIRRDEASLTRAARGLAGLGSGLTPSGDDLLAGFAASWVLVGEALGVEASSHRRLTDALVAGAQLGASPLGLAWIRHAGRGELLEPMTGFVAALLAAAPCDPGPCARAALRVGSSSGTDWMVGFLLGATAALDATTGGRPW
jgi:hypothetical protein